MTNPISSPNDIGPKGFASGEKHERDNDPAYNKAPNDKVIKGNNNSFIVLGRDRPGGLNSGYSGKGHNKAGAIDIVAGRVSSIQTSIIDGPVNPSFGADAARVYLTQKGDIDAYFNLPRGGMAYSVARSAVAMKADDIRIIGRESIKLVTKTDAITSNKEAIAVNQGIQLITKDNNYKDEDMQPMVKGENLRNALTVLAERIFSLQGIVYNFIKEQYRFNESVSFHTHLTNYNATPTQKSDTLISAGQSFVINVNGITEIDINKLTYNLNLFSKDYLWETSTTCITSKYHKLN
jgi:hypothetical protein